VGINGVFAPHPSKIRDFCHLLPREKALDCTINKQLEKLGFVFFIVAQMRQECHRKFLDSIHWA
jgi:hypothetical protein